jgi:methylated-DNA-[protein]-cysteine S-methyltransferase
MTGSSTQFQRRVWLATRQIPYGDVRSYGEIARAIDSPHAARAVGQALGRNPLLIVVPCHRVLRSDGDLGGFGAGLGKKRALLTLEGYLED